MTDFELRRTNARRHATRRMRERFDLDYSEEIRNRLLGQIRAGAATLLGNQEGGRALFLVYTHGTEIAAAFDSVLGEIVTVFPREWVGRAHDRRDD